MFSSLKGKFQFVQDGLSASLRNFKIKDEKRSDPSTASLNFDAGMEILIENEIECGEIHSLYESNVHKAELVDKKIIEIHGRLSDHLHSLQEINGFTSNLSKFVKRLEGISEELDLQNAVDEAEESLMMFEDLIESEELRQKQIDAEFEFRIYVEKKNHEVDVMKKKFEDEHFYKLIEKEKEMQSVLKDRQELYGMAFQQDMQLYKESGIIPNLRSNEMPSIVNLEDVVIEDDLKGLYELLES